MSLALLYCADESDSLRRTVVPMVTVKHLINEKARLQLFFLFVLTNSYFVKF